MRGTQTCLLYAMVLMVVCGSLTLTDSIMRGYWPTDLTEVAGQQDDASTVVSANSMSAQVAFFATVDCTVQLLNWCMSKDFVVLLDFLLRG